MVFVRVVNTNYVKTFYYEVKLQLCALTTDYFCFTFFLNFITVNIILMFWGFNLY